MSAQQRRKPSEVVSEGIGEFAEMGASLTEAPLMQPPCDPDPAETDELSVAERQDAARLQALLADAFVQPQAELPLDVPPQPVQPQAEPEEMEPAPIVPAPPSASVRGKWIGRIVKSLLGLLILAFVVWEPARQLFQTASVEAVVNARLVTLRSPIDGFVSAGAGAPGTGAHVTAGATLLQIGNERADRSVLDAANRALSASLDERWQMTGELDALRRQQAELEQQVAAFREARIDMLKAELAVDPPPANAAAIAIEIDALSRGVFVGEGYNDKPSSAQRLDQLGVQIAVLETQLAANIAGQARLAAAVADEQARYDQLSTASIVAPATGRVWEMLTAPGEQVAAGQDLLRMLDCSQPIVTAAVSEAVYNRLSIGMPATFTFREGGEPHPGEVVSLTGFAMAPANLAIAPSALRAEPYRVTILVPSIAGSDNCAIGRTGRVVFGNGG